ncbi:hypothetical protein T01_15356 [Trichinella spiralis]|uniref:Uncharacterized protein n=1 Tax=Trichinella spiralis TaxID=6334 RepID=A0A0V1AYN9_TRISP|nr:hypothetical protein T01_15356 [Trichinella spiralis]
MKLMISHLHLETQEWKIDVNDRKTAISLQTIDGTKRTREDKWQKFIFTRFSISLKSLLTLHAYRPSLKQISSVYSRDHHLFRKQRSICLKSTQLKRRQYEVEQKKAGGAGGYFSGSIPLVPAPDIRKG